MHRHIPADASPCLAYAPARPGGKKAAAVRGHPRKSMSASPSLVLVIARFTAERGRIANQKRVPLYV